MVEACVKDTSSYLSKIQKHREDLEAMLAEGSAEDAVHQCTQSLTCILKDYKIAASHVKKHCAKPKQNASGGTGTEPVPEASADANKSAS